MLNQVQVACYECPIPDCITPGWGVSNILDTVSKYTEDTAYYCTFILSWIHFQALEMYLKFLKIQPLHISLYYLR